MDIPEEHDDYIQFGNIRIPRWHDERPILVRIANSLHVRLIRFVVGRRTVIMNAHILNGIVLAEPNNAIIRDNLFENGGPGSICERVTGDHNNYPLMWEKLKQTMQEIWNE